MNPTEVFYGIVSCVALFNALNNEELYSSLKNRWLLVMAFGVGHKKNNTVASVVSVQVCDATAA